MADKDTQTNESMEDILASIRETVEAEAGETVPEFDSMEAPVTKPGAPVDMPVVDEEPFAPSENTPAVEEAAPAAPVEEPAAPSVETPAPAEEVKAEAVEVDEEILDLTEMVPEEPVAIEAADGDSGEGMVDINAFAESGAIQNAASDSVDEARKVYTGEEAEQGKGQNELAAAAALMDEPAPSEPAAAEEAQAPTEPEQLPSDTAAAEEMMAAVEEAPAEETTPEVSAEEKAEAEASVDDMVADIVAEEAPAEEVKEETTEEAPEEMLAEAAAEADEVSEEAAEEVVEEPIEEAEPEMEAAPVEEEEKPKAKRKARKKSDIDELTDAAMGKVNLNTIPTATGLQVAFPAEILAEALRPLVKDWIGENLQDIVERLVREELSKLAER